MTKKKTKTPVTNKAKKAARKTVSGRKSKRNKRVRNTRTKKLAAAAAAAQVPKPPLTDHNDVRTSPADYNDQRADVITHA